MRARRDGWDALRSYRENSLKKNLVGGMVWFAIYETAKERYGSQMSLPLYEKMCRASISMPMMLRMARKAKPFTRKFQESMMKRYERENRIDSPYNWQAHYKQGKVDEEFTGHLHNHVGLTENFDQSENEEFLVNDSP